jgi:predicted ATP-grasp superfamily ATP-dependent carboligase
MLADLARRDVVAFDLFGDRDLRARRVVTAGGLRGLVEAAVAEPAGSVVYGASFENHPALVARLAERHALLGNTPDTLRAVRDPARLGAVLRDAGLAFPSLAPTRGLRKPLRGGGGTRVRDWRGGRLPAGTYAQERIDGLPCSVAAVAAGGDAAVLGTSEQLIGERAFGVRGYRWCGNLTPPRLPAHERHALLEQARAICSCLAAAFALRGLFGVDFIWDGERAWTHEVNPRPTASLEALEAAYGLGVFEAHLRGCAGALPGLEPQRSRAAGKAVVFATEPVTVGDLEGVRDVPHPGERIAAGRPICTVVATAATPEAVFAALEAQAARLRVGVPA